MSTCKTFKKRALRMHQNKTPVRRFSVGTCNGIQPQTLMQTKLRGIQKQFEAEQRHAKILINSVVDAAFIAGHDDRELFEDHKSPAFWGMSGQEVLFLHVKEKWICHTGVNSFWDMTIPWIEVERFLSMY